MTRIIAGSARGRPLKSPRGLRLRPTASKVREAIFSILASQIPASQVLDLYCGIGSLGIEALSRSAGHCSFIDSDPRALAIVHANLETTGFVERSRCLKRRLPKQIDRSLGGPFDLVFSDPPYADDPVPMLAYQMTETPGLLTDETVWVHEGPSKRIADGGGSYQLEGWEQTDIRRYGDTTLWIFRRLPRN